MINTLLAIQKCFKQDKVYYSHHSKVEMEEEEFGEIKEHEVFETIISGKVIETYPDDKPYPSVLIYGQTRQNRPIHIVCAYDQDDNLAIIVTVYEPNPMLWIDYQIRKK